MGSFGVYWKVPDAACIVVQFNDFNDSLKAIPCNTNDKQVNGIRTSIDHTFTIHLSAILAQ
jgi:hypothetical protein